MQYRHVFSIMTLSQTHGTMICKVSKLVNLYWFYCGFGIINCLSYRYIDKYLQYVSYDSKLLGLGRSNICHPSSFLNLMRLFFNFFFMSFVMFLLLFLFWLIIDFLSCSSNFSSHHVNLQYYSWLFLKSILHGNFDNYGAGFVFFAFALIVCATCPCVF